jgi:sulfite exporter TauE/SafE
MNSLTRIFSGYLAGLSVGVYCIGICLPLFLPILFSQKRTTKTSFFLVIEFSLGRLTGYLLFGLIFGWLGLVVRNNLIHSLITLTNFWVGIVMIIYSLGMINNKFCSLFPFKKIKWPFLVGFLTGINVCPPFIASLSYVFNLKDIIISILYFLMFFLGSSTYIIPVALFGPLTKINRLQKVAQFSGMVVGLYFIYQSLIKFF